MTAVSRRSIIKSLIVGSCLSGCVSTKTNHVVTTTISTDKVLAYSQAALNAVQAVDTVLGMFPSLSAYTTPLAIAVAALQDATKNFAKVAGSKLVVIYDETNVRTRIDSILTIIQQIGVIIGQILSTMASASFHISKDTFSNIKLIHQSILTLISIFQLILSNAFTASAVTRSPGILLQEKAAFKTLGVA